MAESEQPEAVVSNTDRDVAPTGEHRLDTGDGSFHSRHSATRLSGWFLLLSFVVAAAPVAAPSTVVAHWLFPWLMPLALLIVVARFVLGWPLRFRVAALVVVALVLAQTSAWWLPVTYTPLRDPVSPSSTLTVASVRVTSGSPLELAQVGQALTSAAQVLVIYGTSHVSAEVLTTPPGGFRNVFSYAGDAVTGIAVLSRLPVANVTLPELQPDRPTPSVTVMVDDRPIQVLAFSADPGSERWSDVVNQVQKMAMWVGSQRTPVVLAADLPALSSSEPALTLLRQMHMSAPGDGHPAQTQLGLWPLSLGTRSDFWFSAELTSDALRPMNVSSTTRVGVEMTVSGVGSGGVSR